ncbi:hypothetical protein [Psychrobacter aestuarii]|uniref:Uncharacterized protein n=1 Tax=Psychrobacter aestuarii TaxID=556327 RepID=A0ABP3FGH4_9GAMM|nr:hypothetical protein [Psychrobacter aestuarii]
MAVFGKITTLLGLGKQNDLLITDPQTPTDINIAILTNCAITCRCGGMALPTQVKGNEYCCLRCDKQMLNIRYNLGQRAESDDDWCIQPKDEKHMIDMAHYDEAYKQIKARYGK